MKNTFYILFITLFAFSCSKVPSQKKSKFDYIFTVSTEYGEFQMLLFDETPKHKENFLNLVQAGFYDSTTFHRVLDNFMIQGGDPNSKPDGNGKLGLGGPGYNMEAEIVEELKHDKGMVGAARMPDNNPTRESSGSQFYIVEAEKGAHHLDGEYTVFGRVFSGMEVVEKIAEQKVNRKGLPSKPIYMRINYVKAKRKKIAETYGIEGY